MGNQYIYMNGEFVEKVKKNVDKNQKDFLLREQQKVIREELGEDDIAATVVVGPRDADQTNQWRIADKILQGFIHACAATRYIGKRPPRPWPSAPRNRLRADCSGRPG